MIFGIAANSPSEALGAGFTNPNLWLAGAVIRSKWGAGSFFGSVKFFGFFALISFVLVTLMFSYEVASGTAKYLEDPLTAFLILAMFMLGAFGAAISSAGITSVLVNVTRIGADK